LYPLLEGYTKKCKIKNTQKDLFQSIKGTWLTANKKTGNKKREK
jgi:hypothetical protein